MRTQLDCGWAKARRRRVPSVLPLLICALACGERSAPTDGGAAHAGSGSPPVAGASADGGASDAASGASPNHDGGDVDGGKTVRSTGPGSWGPGDYPSDPTEQTYLEIEDVPGQNGHVRQYKVHVPPSYDPNVPAPLVFCFHGFTQDAVMFCVNGAGMLEKSDQAGFILVMPNGYQNSWNAGTCCGAASTEQLDDIALVRAIFEEVGAHVNIDLDRVYATGLSNGGSFSYRLACEAADVFAAIASGSGHLALNDIGGGTNPSSDLTTCEPSQPIPILHAHGTADGVVPYALQAQSLQHMAAQYGCADETEPATSPASGGDTTCVRQKGCPAGVEVIGCSVEDGGHVWFGAEDCGTGGCFIGNNSDTLVNTDAIWDFFSGISR